MRRRGWRGRQRAPSSCGSVSPRAADRRRLSLEANPIDVHRATDAALVGLDHVAQNHKNVLFIVTSNFTTAVDDALKSRLDLVYEMPMPDRGAVRMILEDTLKAVG